MNDENKMSSQTSDVPVGEASCLLVRDWGEKKKIKYSACDGSSDHAYVGFPEPVSGNAT